MGFFSDKFVKLTDANPELKDQPAEARALYINKHMITAFYRREDDATKSNLFTADGKAYTVKESPEHIYDEMESIL